MSSLASVVRGKLYQCVGASKAMRQEARATGGVMSPWALNELETACWDKPIQVAIRAACFNLRNFGRAVRENCLKNPSDVVIAQACLRGPNSLF